jgi:endonuclease/exonuclease/phosphatase family metal-dependent hydrolase
LQELYQKIQRSNSPLMIGADFNMIQYAHEISSGSEYTIWLDMFNSFINDTSIMESVRGGSRFTWTNKLDNPIRSNLDRIFVYKCRDQQYPRVRVVTLTRVGSDHNPLILDDGTKIDQEKKLFRFE